MPSETKRSILVSTQAGKARKYPTREVQNDQQ
nr:MAG TPA_asm: hypothetical protein [Caudoviricetes sp.]